MSRLALPGLILALSFLGKAHAQGPDIAPQVMAALRNCLPYSSGQIPKASDVANVPPGLIRGGAVHVSPLPGTNENAFRYEGTDPRVMSCGVAVYGPVSNSLHQDVRNLLAQFAESRKWQPHSSGPWQDLVPATERSYWSGGPAGVIMLSRPPTALAPTLDVEYHSTLLLSPPPAPPPGR
jgi:hypothetical protein